MNLQKALEAARAAMGAPMDFEAKEVVARLVKGGFISPDRQEEAHATLCHFYRDTVGDFWTIEDVQRHHDLTDEEAREVLASVDRRKDCSVGINWQVIDQWCEELFPGRGDG